jgi:hypothetical protein
MTTKTDTIAVNLTALADTLDQAHAAAQAAAEAIAKGERNLAIGNLLDLEWLLPDAHALNGAVMALHRSKRDN